VDNEKETGLISIPKDGKRAIELIQKTQESSGQIPFWRPNKWATFLPSGVRKYPEVAQFDSSYEHTRHDYVLLKYRDGCTATIGTDKLYKGHVVYPSEVTHKWMIAKPGEKNIKHQIVGEEDA
jgi:hypothetical protein